jgi:preprotein translocase subunit Sec61beta
MLIIRKNIGNRFIDRDVSFMSKSKKKKEKSSPMPAASAGLLRFFEEETEGIKVRPEILIGFAITLIVVAVLADVFFA